MIKRTLVERRQGGRRQGAKRDKHHQLRIPQTNIQLNPSPFFDCRLRLDLRMWLYVYNHSKLYQANTDPDIQRSTLAVSHISTVSTLTHNIHRNNTTVVVVVIVVGKGNPEWITVEYIQLHSPQSPPYIYIRNINKYDLTLAARPTAFNYPPFGS